MITKYEMMRIIANEIERQHQVPKYDGLYYHFWNKIDGSVEENITKSIINAEDITICIDGDLNLSTLAVTILSKIGDKDHG